MIESFAQLHPGLEHSAVLVAREVLGREGGADEVIERLLAAQNWESRMIAAWKAVDEDARKAARSLDYQSFITHQRQNQKADIQFTVRLEKTKPA